MFLPDKRVIEMLVLACEELWVQNMQFRTLLKTAGVEDLPRKLGTLEHSVAANSARAGFQKMYAQALAKGEEAALRDFLNKLPLTSRIQ